MKICERFAGDEWSYCIYYINPCAGKPFSCDFAGDEKKCIFKRFENSIRDDEREKMLEKVRNECIKDESVGYTIFRILETLRQEGRSRG